MATSSLILGPMIGGLSHNSANVWARADGPSTLYVWVGTQAEGKGAKLAGSVELHDHDGFAGVVALKKLSAETEYYFAVTLQQSRPKRGDFHRFKTFPKPGQAASFSFMFGSCYLPPDEHGGQTLDVLRQQVKDDDLRFGLMLGDQIYADDAKGNGIGHIAVSLKDYRGAYQYVWSRPAFRDLQAELPLFMTLDDHEVEDDWSWRDENRKWAGIPWFNKVLRWLKRIPPEQRHLSPERVKAALKTYVEHQAIHAPKLLLPPKTNSLGELTLGKDDGNFAYTFETGKAAFFVLDTRSMRVINGKKRVLLGEKQWGFLQDWLLKTKDKYPVKFLVSSGTILHPFWLDVTRDRWNGFPVERERLLEFLAVHEIEGVHILCGDLHTAHAVSAELNCPSGKRIPIHEFCATPFEQKSMFVSNTYHPLFSKWIGKQKKLLHQTGQNFGIVNVGFEKDGAPNVTFTLHYNKNGWKTQPPVITR